MDKNTGRLSVDTTCTLCHDIIEYFAIGHCDHPICFKCSTRMRVLCNQMDCAICRKDIQKVLFIRTLNKFDNIKLTSFCICREKGIFFEDDVIRMAYEKLLENKCLLCKSSQCFKNFKDLETHMQRVHSHFYCDLCMENLKLFTCDRKFYDRKQLAEHKRHGDRNDTSYRLHPICQFCDKRYFDNDALLLHLRKDHYFCHICESNGISNEYFEEYKYLRDHFRDSHFLCEEGSCNEVEFVNAFKSEIDLKAHVSTTHCKNMGRQQTRQLRAIDLEFDYGTRGNGRRGGGRRYDNYRREGASGADGSGFTNQSERRTGHRGQEQRLREQQEKRSEVDAALALSMSLSDVHRQGSVGIMDPQLAQNTQLAVARHNPAMEKKMEFAATSEDFPQLDGQLVTSVVSKQLLHNNEKQKHQKTPDTLAHVLAINAGRSFKDGQLDESDFPSLTSKRSNANIMNGNGNGSQWTGQTQNKGKSIDTQYKNGSSFLSRNDLKAKHRNGLKGKEQHREKDEDRPMLDELSLSLNDVHRHGGVRLIDPQIAYKARVVMSGVESVTDKKKKREMLAADDFPSLASNRPQEVTSSLHATSGNSMSWVGKKETKENPKPKLNEINRVSMGQSMSDFPALDKPANWSQVKLTKAHPSSASWVPKKEVLEVEQSELKETGMLKLSVKNKGKQRVEPQLDSAKHLKLDMASNENKENREVDKMEDKKYNSQVRSVWEQPVKSLAEIALKLTGDCNLKSKGTQKDMAPGDKTAVGEGKSKLNGETVEEGQVKNQDKGSNDGKKQKKQKGTFVATGSNKQNDEENSTCEGNKKLNQKQLSDSEGKLVSKKKRNDSAKTKDGKGFKMPGASDAVDACWNVSSAVKSVTCNTNLSDSNLNNDSAADMYLSSDLDGDADDNRFIAQNESASLSFDLVQGSSVIGECSSRLTEDEYASFTTVVTTEHSTAEKQENVDSAESVPSCLLPLTSESLFAVHQPQILIPPGFSGGANKPPPGFAAKVAPSKPPPGFSKPVSNIVLNDMSNIDLRLLNLVPREKMSYVPPKQSQERYTKLVNNIMSENTGSNFETFKTLSVEFRQGLISGRTYYDKCSEVMGPSALQKIFPELVVLLPDIEKQQELLQAHRSQFSSSGDTGRRKMPWNMEYDELVCCFYCGQVILKCDNTDHMKEHSTSDFPEL